MKIHTRLFLHISVIGFFLCTLLTIGCHHSENQSNAEKAEENQKIQTVKPSQTNIVKPSSQAQETSISSPSSTPIITPAGMQKVSAFAHTSEIGTVYHPTMDGGIINAADGLPVYHPEPVVKSSANAKISNTVDTSHDSISITDSKIPIADSWASSSRIKAILEKAASTGQLDYVLKQSDQKHLPASVALLPIVESAYQDNAISPKGAVGAWQLMPETARENGISAEKRTAFIPSTQAALSYLNQLHQQFGNWTLAYAAYNAGEVRVEQALRENPEASSIEQLNLPQETKNYVRNLIFINKSLLHDSKDEPVYSDVKNINALSEKSEKEG